MTSPRDHVERRRCGSSDLYLPVLGVGCWAYGGGQYWGSQAQSDVDAVVARAIDVGCDYFDTAEAYNDGASEASLGAALKGRRHKAVIGSKVSPSNCCPKVLREHCGASLRRLQTDYIDLYMVHWPLTPRSIRHFTSDPAVIADPPSVADAFAMLLDLKAEGKIRHIGVSNFGVARLQEARQFCPQIVANELPWSLLTRAIEREILPHCRKTGVGVIGYMTLLQGLLADIYRSLDDVPAWQRRTRHFHHAGCELCRHGEQGAEAQTAEALAAIRAIAEQCGITMPQIAVKWAVARQGMTCALTGARTLSELDQNVQAVCEPLTPDVIRALDEVTSRLNEHLGPSFDYYENTNNDRTR